MGASTWWGWVSTNLDTMGMAMVCAFFSAGISTLLQKMRGSTVAVALMSSTMFTSIFIPSAAVKFHWGFPELLTLAVFIGFTGLALSWGFIIAGDKAKTKVAVIFDRWTDKWVPPSEQERAGWNQGQQNRWPEQRRFDQQQSDDAPRPVPNFDPFNPNGTKS